MSAYLVVDITVHNAVRYLEYARPVPAIVQKHGGEYLLRGGNTVALEGNWQPQRLVLLKFPDANRARS